MLLGATFCQNMIVYGIPIEMINVFIKHLEIKHFIAMLNYILFITHRFTFKTVSANISEATAALTDAAGANRICIFTWHGIRTETIRRTICNED